MRAETLKKENIFFKFINHKNSDAFRLGSRFSESIREIGKMGVVDEDNPRYSMATDIVTSVS